MNDFFLKAAAGTYRGRVRQNNEDFYAYYFPSNPISFQKQGALFLVADGVGSRSDGSLASKTACETVIHLYEQQEAPSPQALVQFIESANQRIFAMEGNSATTLLAGLFLGNQLHIANVGDCTAYLMTGQALRQLNALHSVALDPANPVKQKLTRALGNKEQVEVDLFIYPIQSGDTLLLLSDGVTRYLKAETIQEIVASGMSPQQMVGLLINRANDAGGADNLTAAIVRVEPPIADVQAFVEQRAALKVDVDFVPQQAPRQATAIAPSQRQAHGSALSSSQSAPAFAQPTLSPPMMAGTAQTLPVQTRRSYYGWLAGLGLLLLIILAGGFWVLNQPSDEPAVSDPATQTPEPSPVTLTPSALPPTATATLIPTVTITPTFTATPLTLSEGVAIVFQGSAVTYQRIGETVTAYTIIPDYRYVIASVFEDETGQTWYRINDTEREQYGWINEANLPAYQLEP